MKRITATLKSHSVETRRVLLVDDDPLFIESLQDAVEDIVELHVVSSASDAMAISRVWKPDLVILDVLLRHGDAFELLDHIRAVRGHEPYGIIYLAKGRGARTQYQPLGNELFGILKRDFDVLRLRSEVLKALHLTADPRTSAA